MRGPEGPLVPCRFEHHGHRGEGCPWETLELAKASPDLEDV